MKKCGQCAFNLKDTDKFCMQCGTPVPQVPQLTAEKARGLQPRWLWAGAAIILVAMIGSAAWIVANRTVQASPTRPQHHTKSRRTHKAKALVAKTSSTSPPSESETTLITRTMSSVVEVVVTTSQGSDLGSGFVYNQQGDILTNDHVVSGASLVSVKTERGQVYQATIIGANPSLDVAVLHVSGLSLKPLKINAQYAGALGDNVLAFGSPLGLSSTVTTGIISGLSRQFTIHGVNYQNMLQISAPIAPGNSGGPLVLATTGAVIGMDTAGDPSSSGNIGFAIPMSRVYPSALQWAAHPESNPVTLLPSSNPSPSTPPSPSPSMVPSPSTVPSPSPGPSSSPSPSSNPPSPSTAQNSSATSTPSSGSAPSTSPAPSSNPPSSPYS